jgi:hypothetical protein
MAAGDGQRAWFPEMMAELKDIWIPQMSWEECAVLCQRMTVFRESIWKNRNIKPQGHGVQIAKNTTIVVLQKFR